MPIKTASKAEVKAIMRDLVIKDEYLCIGNRTIAIVTIEEPFTRKQHVAIGYAVASPKDKYDKELGKKIAKGRAIGRMAEFDFDDDNPVVPFFKRWIKDQKKVEKIPEDEIPIFISATYLPPTDKNTTPRFKIISTSAVKEQLPV